MLRPGDSDDPPGGGRRRRVLILCTGNSCRSQMAEGWINHLLKDAWVAFSAGTPARRRGPSAGGASDGRSRHRHPPRSSGRPEHVDRYLGEPWDLVVTVCDSAHEECPHFPGGVARRHVSFDDPAGVAGNEVEQETVFRRVRDEIRERLIPEIARFDSST